MDRFPHCMIMLMNLVTNALWYCGSATCARLDACRLRDINILKACRWFHFRRRDDRRLLLCCGRGCSALGAAGLGPFDAVLGTAAPAFFHALRVEVAADDVVAHAGQ